MNETKRAHFVLMNLTSSCDVTTNDPHQSVILKFAGKEQQSRSCGQILQALGN